MVELLYCGHPRDYVNSPLSYWRLFCTLACVHVSGSMDSVRPILEVFSREVPLRQVYLCEINTYM